VAYFQNDDDENQTAQGMNNPQQTTDQNQPQQQNTPQLSGGAGAIPTASQAPATPKATSSGMTSFQNIQKANQGQATTRLNNAAVGSVNNQAQQAGTSINRATNAFNQKVDLGSLQNRDGAVDDVRNVVNQARQLTTENNQIDQPQQSRFQEVINAKYEGPQSLRQSGDYENAAGDVQKAQTALNQTKDAGGREELLKNLFSNYNNYNQGLNKLDSGILNASTEGVKGLQDAASQHGNIANRLDQAQIGSANLAQNRTQEIRGIRSQARDVFTQGKNEEQLGTDNRIQQVVDDWDKLPNYFKDIIRNKGTTNTEILNNTVNEFKTNSNYDQIQSRVNALAPAIKAMESAQKALKKTNNTSQKFRLSQTIKKGKKVLGEYTQLRGQLNSLNKQLSNINNTFNKNAVILNPFESAILGVNSGEGLYNMGEDVIRTNTYDRERLISQDEQLRLAALSQLGGLDRDSLLDTSLKYGNAEKAGTMSALDALNLDGVRSALNESEGDFRNWAEGTNITGRGHKKVSRGNAFGKKTKNYYAKQKGNVGNMLSSAGYDLNSELGTGQAAIGGRELLEAALKASQTDRDAGGADRADALATLAGMGAGGYAGAKAGTAIAPGAGTAIGAGVGGMLGGYAASGTTDPYQNFSDALIGLGGPTGELAKAFQDARGHLGDIAGTGMKYSPAGFVADNVAKSLGLGNNFVSSGIGGAIGGISSSAMASFGNAEAKANAIKDLQNKYAKALSQQGFDNRFAVTQNEEVTGRLNLLQELLANLDKTNTKV
jgi:hypothetical protein